MKLPWEGYGKKDGGGEKELCVTWGGGCKKGGGGVEA